MKQEPLVIERTFNAPSSRVWEAITEKEKMKEWYFDLAEFKPEVGFEFSFTAGDEKKSYLHICRITEIEPGKKLTYSWQYEGDPGISYVTFELIPKGDKTTVKLTHAGLENFSPDNPDLARHNFERGWNEIIGVSLKEFVEKS